MRSERLSCAQAAKLVRLNAGESLPRSQLPQNILIPLQHGGVVELEKSGSSYVVRGLPGKLAGFVAQHWGIKDLALYAQAEPGNRSRSLFADIAGDSKALPNHPLNGIFIRSFDNCFLGDKPLHNSPPGTAVLVTMGDLPNLRVAAPYLIALENAECLWKFEQALSYFPNLVALDYALVLRWHWDNAWRQWLVQWKGQLMYFPDYDPAGLRIFATEVLPFRPTTQLLVPRDFEAILEDRGDRDLYLRHEKYMNFVAACEHPEVTRLCRALRKARKAFEQETLLS
jgi:hypothetical protein